MAYREVSPRAAHQTEIDGLNRRHDERIREIKSEHRDVIVKLEEKHHAAISKLEDDLRVTIRRLEADRPEDDRARRTSRLGEADDPSGKASTNPSSKRDDDSRRLLPQYRNPAPTGRLADIAPGRGGPPTDRADNTSVPVACHARRGGEPVDRVVGGDFGVPVPRRASPGGVPLYRVLGAGDLGVPVARRRGRGGEPFDRSGRTRGSDIPAVIRPPLLPDVRRGARRSVDGGQHPVIRITRSRGVLVADRGKQVNVYTIRIRVPALSFGRVLRHTKVRAALRLLAREPRNLGLRRRAVEHFSRERTGGVGSKGASGLDSKLSDAQLAWLKEPGPVPAGLR